jgi:hypothetical protein
MAELSARIIQPRPFDLGGVKGISYVAYGSGADTAFPHVRAVPKAGLVARKLGIHYAPAIVCRLVLLPNGITSL